MTYGGDRDQHTICAVSTPSGFGGVAVIRVSGPQAFEISKKIAGFLPEKPESHKIYFGTLQTLAEKQAMDEVLVSTFHKGKSYTGEETAEISCHGSPAITQWILQELVLAGARLADRGEFSYRAFIHGKIDLVQAEGVLQMVESQSKRSAQQGLRQLKGGLSQKLNEIKKELLYVLASIEAAIDFSTEDIDVLDKKSLLARVKTAESGLETLLLTYEKGRFLREGLQVALAGAPNVGKSSLFNLLLQEDRSIVTEIPGTTRDVVEASVLLDGVRVSFLDTAGIRNSSDVVEKIGIEKSREYQALADVVFLMFDSVSGLSPEDLALVREINSDRLLLIGNKIDKVTASPETLLEKTAEQLRSARVFTNREDLNLFLKQRTFFITTLQPQFRDLILKGLQLFVNTESMEDEAVISQARHFEALTRAQDLIKKSLSALRDSGELEFLALELKEALILIQETLGERFDDQIMDFVFKQFCIGK